MQQEPIGEDLLREIRQRAAAREDEKDLLVVERARGAWRVSVRLRDADRLGVLLDEVELTCHDADAAPQDLDRQARGILESVRSLGERLALIEMEPGLDRAVLRSASPLLLPEALEYDEVELRGGHRALVRRYRFDRATGRRRHVPANLGAEALPRLVRELLEALSP